MSSQLRYIPEWPLPESVFIPGVNAHPHWDDPKVTAIDPAQPQENDFFKFALDLFNLGYFWESHVYFEALWNVHERQGSVAEFCQAMIKLGAAGVKLNQKRNENCISQLKRARELFQVIESREGIRFLNFNLKKISQNIDSSLESNLSLFLVQFEK